MHVLVTSWMGFWVSIP